MLFNCLGFFVLFFVFLQFLQCFERILEAECAMKRLPRKEQAAGDPCQPLPSHPAAGARGTGSHLRHQDHSGGFMQYLKVTNYPPLNKIEVFPQIESNTSYKIARSRLIMEEIFSSINYL